MQGRGVKLSQNQLDFLNAAENINREKERFEKAQVALKDLENKDKAMQAKELRLIKDLLAKNLTEQLKLSAGG
jgi:flagellar motor switch protein FliM